MREKRQGNKVPKRPKGKWDKGDLSDNDAVIFKYLPDPKDFLKEGGSKNKKKKSHP